MFECIFFSEFDNIAGPKITFQVPKSFVTPETFDGISEYIIPKPVLAGKLISLNAYKLKFVGFPVLIDSSKYHRNALLFNTTFVFSENFDTRPYEAVVRKFADILLTLEQESDFLSLPQSKEQLEGILQQVYQDLNSRGECVIKVDDVNTINLKLFPKLEDPPSVLDHQVPVRIVDLDSLSSKCWDLTMLQVIPFIDGVNYVSRISKLTGIDILLVKMCLQHLLYYGCITMIDIFQYGNVYTSTPKIRNLANNPEMQKACVEYVSVSGMKPPSFSKVFTLYCALHPAITFREFCQEHDLPSFSIDNRKFITFGVVNGFLRRIHRYPLMIEPSLTKQHSAHINTTNLVTTIQPKQAKPSFKHLADGNHCYDEICCAIKASSQTVSSILSSEINFIDICK